MKHIFSVRELCVPIVLISLLALTHWLGLYSDMRYLANDGFAQAVTSHYVHANLSHLVLNISALVALVVLFPSISPLWFAVMLITVTLATSGCIILLGINGSSYVGFSGVYYGLLSACAINNMRHSRIALCVLIFIIVKTTYEQLSGTIEIEGGLVAHQVHLYGVICGSVLSLSYLCGRYFLAKKGVLPTTA